MPCAPKVVRATAVLLVCAGALAACGVTGKTAKASPEAPSTTAVVKARFATLVDLDHGGLLVAPPAATTRATITEQQADAMFEATDVVEGPHEFAIFGLGVVTVATSAEQPPSTTSTTTTTTAPPPPSTVPSTTSPPRPTTPTASDRGSSLGRATLIATPPSTATTPSTALPPTTTPGVGIPQPPVLPRYRRRLAWVGITWGAVETCPGSTTTQAASATTPSYVAVIIDARTGHQVIAYRSDGSSPCNGATGTPVVTEPNELLSVPWQVVGPASTAVQIEVPACGHYYGWTQLPAAGNGVTDQVVVSVPFDPTCGATVSLSQSVDQVVPLGTGQGLVGHAPLGPVQALQALPSD